MANYLDKNEFLSDIIAYKARKELNPDEQITDYSAKAIMMIAERLANRPNFSGYSYKQDMVSDAIYICLRYFDRFDPHHPTKNPFGYFSRIAWFAFLQRLAKEKKQVAIKGKILAMVPFDTFDVQDQDLDEGFKNSFTEFLQEHNHTEIDIKPVKKSKATSIMDDCLDDCASDFIDDDSINIDEPELKLLLSMTDEDEDSND